MSGRADVPVVRVSRTLDRCGVLGPGQRAVVWVQGCPLRCVGCVAPQTLPFTGGRVVSVEDLAAWLAGLDGIEGVTLSGGEPFAQAEALAVLLDRVRTLRPELTAMAYSGFRHEVLRRRPEGRALLDCLDILIDGPYVERRHADLRWRGSANQRVIVLSERYEDVSAQADVGQGIEVSLDPDGALSWAGVPAVRGFRERVELGLIRRGYAVGEPEETAVRESEEELS